MQFFTDETLDLSIVMPCLNEEKTVGLCVDQAKDYIKRKDITGEVIVVDNGSDDGSVKNASKHGAYVIVEENVGYGAAIRKGIANSSGRVIIIGDCDTTYDFSDLDKFFDPLNSNKCDFMMGNRLSGGIKKGAMSLSHKIGVRFLSACGRKKFNVDVKDFHSGLRGITRNAAMKMELNTIGMEFATEMIAVAAKNNLNILQTDITLNKCQYERKSKLKTIRDGLRHLNYIIKA